jgi:hypothetical protein
MSTNAFGFDFDELMNLVDGEDFEERPVDVEEFIYGEAYLNLRDNGKVNIELSEYQLTLIRASSQIYKEETLISLYGEVEGRRRFKETCNEIIFQLGKGSGKDFTSTIAVAYIVYLLLCLRDPAAYYGKPGGDSIDILNIAVNAQQAQRVFFENFVIRIERSPWFINKFEKKSGHIAFDKNVNVYSGHSERESWEGYNVLYVVLDEISAFALDSTSGNTNAKTAQAIYDMYRASVTSRFPEFGKLVLLSFPRYKDDFIQQRYNAVVLEKETVIKRQTLKLDPDLPDGIEGNEFEVEWEYDEIISYKLPRVFALKRTSWEVNPTKSIHSYTRDFFENYIDALSRFACMPPESIDAFFKDKQKVERAFNGLNGVDNDTGQFRTGFDPDPKKRYYVHVDLAKKHDHCAVTMAHVEGWEKKEFAGRISEPSPVIKVDAVRWWTPTSDKNVDFVEVRNYIVSLRQRGFNIRRVTFDRWRSDDMIEYLNNIGIKADLLSVDIKHYTDLAIVVQEERIGGPNIPLLHKELLRLRIMPNGKIDHPRDGSKDLADATCGAVFNAISLTPRTRFDTIDIVTAESLRDDALMEEQRQRELEDPNMPRSFEEDDKFRGQIKPPGPPREMPAEIGDWINNLRVV